MASLAAYVWLADVQAASLHNPCKKGLGLSPNASIECDSPALSTSLRICDWPLCITFWALTEIWHDVNWIDMMTWHDMSAILNSKLSKQWTAMGGLAAAWPGPPHPPLRVGATRALTDQPTSLRTKQKLIGLSFAISRRNLQAPNSRIYWQDSWT